MASVLMKGEQVPHVESVPEHKEVNQHAEPTPEATDTPDHLGSDFKSPEPQPQLCCSLCQCFKSEYFKRLHEGQGMESGQFDLISACIDITVYAPPESLPKAVKNITYYLPFLA